VDLVKTDVLDETLVTADAAESDAVDELEEPRITALVVRAKEGDAEAFADLMHLYERRILSLGRQMGLRREDALDACQEAFVKVFRYIGKFETGRSFFKWLYRIAIHAIYDQMRLGRMPRTVSLEEIELDEADARQGAPSLHARLESVQLARRVRESLDCLSRRERIVFVLRDLHGIDSDRIGAILGLSQVTVRRHCMSARHKLRERLSPRAD
jgi:RNA polymerase sigma-70 factor, ECF subfamily